MDLDLKYEAIRSRLLASLKESNLLGQYIKYFDFLKKRSIGRFINNTRGTHLFIGKLSVNNTTATTELVEELRIIDRHSILRANKEKLTLRDFKPTGFNAKELYLHYTRLYLKDKGFKPKTNPIILTLLLSSIFALTTFGIFVIFATSIMGQGILWWAAILTVSLFLFLSVRLLLYKPS